MRCLDFAFWMTRGAQQQWTKTDQNVLSHCRTPSCWYMDFPLISKNSFPFHCGDILNLKNSCHLSSIEAGLWVCLHYPELFRRSGCLADLSWPIQTETLPRCLDLTTDGKQAFLHGMDPVGRITRCNIQIAQLMADHPSDEDHTMDLPIHGMAHRIGWWENFNRKPHHIWWLKPMGFRLRFSPTKQSMEWLG